MHKNKRADRRPEGLIEGASRPEGQRRPTKMQIRPWSRAEELVLVAGILNCQNKRHYTMMVPNLLNLLDRTPQYPEGSNPSEAKHLDNCIRAVELRLVSKMLTGYGGWFPYNITAGMTNYFRTGRLTWGERIKILRPYARKDLVVGTCQGKMLLKHSDLFHLIRRNRNFDEKLVYDYLSWFMKAKKKELDMEEQEVSSETTTYVPVNPGNLDDLRRHVVLLDNSIREEQSYSRQNDYLDSIETQMRGTLCAEHS